MWDVFVLIIQKNMGKEDHKSLLDEADSIVLSILAGTVLRKAVSRG